MKRLLLFSFLFLLGVWAQAKTFSSTTPESCIANTGGSVTLSYTNVPQASDSVTITFYYRGDLNGTSSNTEKFDFYDENNNLLGTSNYVFPQCSPTKDSIMVKVSASDYNSWLADGQVDILADADATVSANLSSCSSFGGSCAQAKVEYVTTVGNCANAFSGFKIDSISGTSAKVDWAPGSGNASFYLEYGTSGFTQGNGTKISGTYPGAQPPVVLTGLTAQTTYDVYFGEICNSGADSVYYPNALSFTTTKLCASPTNFSSSNLTSRSVDLSWNQAGSVQEFWVFYGPSGFTPGGTNSNVDTVPGSQLSHTVNGLMPVMNYDIYLTTNCASGNGISDTIGPLSISTPIAGPTGVNCSSGNPTTLLLEEFDNSTSFTGDISTSSGDWNFDNNSTGSSNTGPNGPYSGSHYIYFEGSSSGPASMVSPTIPLGNAVDSAELSFFMHAYGSDIGYLVIRVSTSSASGPFNDTVFYYNQGQLQTSSNDPWQHVGVRLDQYIGQDIWLEFEADRNGSFSSDIAIDSLTIVSCGNFCLPQVSSISFSNITTDSASFALDADTTAAFQYEWGPCGFSQGTGTILSDTTNTRFGGLAANTCYEVYVRKDCGNLTSPWSGPFSFRTQCSPFVATYSQNFDGTSEPAVDNCWTAINNTSSFSFVGTENFRNNSSPNSIELYNGGASSGDVMIVSPAFSDLDSTRQIRFWVNDDDDASDLIVGTMSNNSDAATFTPYDTITAASMPNDTWTEFTVRFDNYSGTDTYIALKHGLGTSFDNIYIDDFVYEPQPSCVPPAANSLGVANVTSATADAYWDSASSGDVTYIEWGTPGFTPGASANLGSGSVAGSIDTFQITSLSPLTTYEFYVRDSCLSAGFSPWVGPFSFITPVQGPQGVNCTSGNPTVLLTEEFDNTSAFTGDISTSSGDWNYDANSTGSFATGPNGPYSGTHYIYFEGSGSGPAEMISPAIDLSSAVDGAELAFWLHAYGDDIGYMNVTASTSATGPFTDTLFALSSEIQTSSNDPWQQVGVDLSSYLGQVVYLKFTADRTNCCSGDVAIDLLTVEACGNFCLPPDNLNVSAMVDTSATLGWDTTSASSYEVWLGAAGFYQGTQTAGGARAVTNTNSLLVDTLSGNTCYDFLVRSICGADTSQWRGPFTFCTPCSPIVAPYLEDFETASGTNPPACWINEQGEGNEDWEFDDETSRQPEASDGDHTFGPGQGGTMAWLDDSDDEDSTNMLSPLIDLSNLSNPQMSFWMWSETENGPPAQQFILFIDVKDANGWHYSVDTFDIENNFWQEFTVDLSSYTNMVQVRFSGEDRDGSFYKDIAIDDVRFGNNIPNDLNLLSAEFDKNSKCLSANDTIVYKVANVKGGNYDLSVHPLTVGYNINGPINSSGGATFNSGTIPAGDTGTYIVTGVDLSQAGSYGLDAWIDTNGFNLSVLNDTLPNPSNITIRDVWDVQPDTTVIITNTTDTVELKAASSLFTGTGFMITEVSHYSGFGTGGPSASWVPDDYLEITGVPGSDLDGYTLEQWENGSLDGSFTFGPGTVLNANGVATIAIGSGNTTDTANYLYDGRGTAGTWSSGSESGKILKDPSGNIVDAVGYPGNTSYTFPAASGVTSAHWSGNISAANGTAGIRLEGADVNSATNWTVVTSSNPQDPGVVNTNVTVPSPTGITGFNWSLNANVIDTVPETVVGPYTTNGVYNYVATYNSPCGVFTDTVVVVVNLPGSCPTPTGLDADVIACDSVDLSWSDAADTALVWNVAAGTTPSGAATMVIGDSTLNITSTTVNTAYDFYVANICGNDTSSIAGPFSYNTDSVGAPVASFTYTYGTGLSLNFDASASAGFGNTYDWDYGDGTQGTGVNSTHTYSAGGSYSITLTVTNACGVDDTTIVVADVDIAENPLSRSLEVYPNPSSEVVYVRFAQVGSATASIRILDMQGREMLQRSTQLSGNETETPVNISQLATGTYILEVESSEMKARKTISIR